MPVPSENSIVGAKSPPTAARVPGRLGGNEAELTAWLAAEVAPTEMSDLSWLCLVRTLGEGVEDRLGLGRDAWLGCEALVADHDGRGA